VIALTLCLAGTRDLIISRNLPAVIIEAELVAPPRA